MGIRWSDWNRVIIFSLFVLVLVLVITAGSIDGAEARTSLQATYALSSNPWCQALAPGDVAKYMSEKLAEMSGEAVSPLFSLTVIGWFHNRCTPEQYKELLPSYYQSDFLIVTFVLLVALAFKDTILSPLGPLKKPFDALGELLHLISASIALPIALIHFSDGVAIPVAESMASISNWIFPVAYATDTNSLMASSGMFLILGKIIGTALGLVLFSAMWTLGNIIEVLIFFSPIPFVDTLLSGIRTCLTAILLFFAYLHPILGAILALAIIFLSIRMFGWSFRFLAFGFVYCADVFCRKWRNLKIDNKGILAFSGAGVSKIKTRSLGRIYPGNKNAIFAYYPFLILPKKRIAVATNYSQNKTRIAREWVAPIILSGDATSGKNTTLFRLPPRYRKHEASVGTYLNLPLTQEGRINRKRGLFAWIGNILS